MKGYIAVRNQFTSMGIISTVLIIISCGSPLTQDLMEQAAVSVRGLAYDAPYLAAPLPTNRTDNLRAEERSEPWDALIYSSAYAGSVVVKFPDSAVISITNQTLTSADKRLAPLLESLDKYPAFAYLPVDRDTMRQAQRRAQREGTRLIDWTQVVRIKAQPAEAAQIMRALNQHVTLFDWAHPMPKLWRTDVGVNKSSVADLSLEQTYLNQNNNGLNISAAWDLGLYGTGQHLVHHEHAWNYEHSDLNIDSATTPTGEPNAPNYVDDAEAIGHGTAMLGIIAAQHNDFGVQGIAPATNIRTVASNASDGSSMQYSLELIADLIEAFAAGDHIGGQTMIVGFQAMGPKTLSMIASGEYDDITACPGCIPGEGYGSVYEATETLVNMGIVVVVGAANGAVDLNDPEQQANACGNYDCKDFTVDDSGSLMVAASNGPNLDKADFSNCGSRVNVFAWGRDIVSTGYGTHPASIAGDPNQWYVNNFGGTSSAKAMIAGMAVLAQEYVDELYANDLQVGQHAYLNSAQIRALFTHPDVGTPPLTTECNIGVQPDMGKALQLLADGTIKPKIVDNGVLCANTESEECLNVCETDPLNPNANCGLICDVQPNHHLCAQWCLAKQETDPTFQVFDDCPTTQRTIGNHQDLDGDKHADIVSWDSTTRTLRIDRSDSSSNGSADGYHDWDFSLTLDADMLDDGRHIPVMHDYNHDDLADFALYNTDTGHWRILFTKSAWLDHTYTVANADTWDLDIDYSNDEAWEAGSRPLAADFDVAQLVRFTDAPQAEIYQTIDRTLVTPSGTWLYDFAYKSVSVDAEFDHSMNLLSGEEALAAPGWAYLPTPSTNLPANWTLASYVTPDTTDNGQTLASGWLGDSTNTITDMFYNTNDLGGQSNYVISGRYGVANEDYACFLNDHSWQVIELQLPTLATVDIPDSYSTPGEPCIPVVADYDGDGADDRALLCNNNEWRIFMSASQELRTITYPQNDNLISPAKIFPGGIDYQDIIETYAPHNFGCPAEETCDIFDLPPPVGPNFVACLKHGGGAMECLGQ